MSEERYKKILDEGSQLIQVSTLDSYEILYANQPAREFTKHGNMPYEREKCYKYMMGLDEQCPFCPMRVMQEGETSRKTEIDNGKQIFMVKTVITEWDNKPAFIEYATDVTVERRAQNIYSNDMKRLLHSIPEARGIYHLNLTKNTNKCLRTETIGDEADTVDKLIEEISMLIESPKDGEEFRVRFNRARLMDDFEQAKNSISMEVVCGVSEEENHWVRVTARSIMNPASGDLECFLYVLDVSNEKNLEELALKDSLTSLYNKRHFEKIVERNMNEHKDVSKAIVFMDIDHFKAINDTFGHLVGDMLLTSFASKLQSVFSDLDVMARFGGDEFCIYLENITEEKLREKLERFKQRLITAQDNLEESKAVLTCSVGVAFLNSGSMAYGMLMEKADVALYKAKASGRNTIVFDTMN